MEEPEEESPEVKDNSKFKITRKFLEHPERAEIKMEGDVKKRYDWVHKELIRLDKLELQFEMFTQKEDDPKISIRELARQFHVDKNTIISWFDKKDKILMEIQEIENRVGSKLKIEDGINSEWDYFDKLGEENIKNLAKSRGVRKDCFELWNFLGGMTDVVYCANAEEGNDYTTLDNKDVPKSVREEVANASYD
jgi:hypothetical protein